MYCDISDGCRDGSSGGRRAGSLPVCVVGPGQAARPGGCTATLACGPVGWYKTRLVFEGSAVAGLARILKDPAMSRVCQITGKRPMSGNTVSHANNKRRRRFLPNLHSQRFWLESEKRWVTLRVSGNGMRTIDKKGVEAVVAELRAQGVKV